MGLKPTRRRSGAPLHDGSEDQTVRQYRYLLRTAPLDALEAAHVEALSALGSLHRETVLRTVQDELVAGAHLHEDDVGPLAHLITLGERRSPGVLTSSIPHPALSGLARAVILSEPAFGLFSGYASWDGIDPEPPVEHDDSEYGERWHAYKEARDHRTPGMNDTFGGRYW
ncbi:hypothetical protein BJ986_001096 [Phycicoccus badiiscoriae]|uniref:Uncharacterized protein n=1 Tax=Pedococcus badiiscoriae TaxID=642776 RepID=A0A852WCT7_9MICO|nr:hypothetical protein [Pedococcus badiiscoriae]NYG06609.1 hypothetical protein [Pedococcus badiiscoriae]